MSISDSGPRDSSGDGDHVQAPSNGAAATHVCHESRELPLVDLAVLEDLEEQVGGPDVARSFAQDFVNMVDQRQSHLVSALERQDRDAALDAVISLKIASAMVGGARLGRLAEKLEVFIRRGGLDSAQALLGAVASHGGATAEELQFGYILKAG
jgi:HPt (histidine-containing phosphotransfer) domain-containing protein